MLKFIESLEPNWLKSQHVPNWLTASLAFVFLFRIPTLVEPYHDLFEMNVLESLNYSLNLFWLKAVFTLWTIITIGFFWKLTEKLSKKNKAISMGSSISFSILTLLPTLGGNTATQQSIIVSLLIIVLYFALPKRNKKHKKYTPAFIFSTIWMLVYLLVSIYFNLFSYQDLMLASPAIAILIGVLLASTKIDQSLTLVPLLLFSLFIIKFDIEYKPSLPYYENFLKFSTSQKSQDEYFKHFGEMTDADYKVAEFLVQSSTPEDNIFVWKDSTPIAILMKRHSSDIYSLESNSKIEIFGNIINNKPKFIVIYPLEDQFKELYPYLQTKYVKVEDIQGVKIWKYSEHLSTLLK